MSEESMQFDDAANPSEQDGQESRYLPGGRIEAEEIRPPTLPMSSTLQNSISTWPARSMFHLCSFPDVLSTFRIA